MPRQIEKAACRVPLEGGAIFKYPYMSSWKLDCTINGERVRKTLSPDKREALRMAAEILEEKRQVEGGEQLPSGDVTVEDVVNAYLAMRRSRLPAALRQNPRLDKTYRIDEDRLRLLLQRLPVQKVAHLRKAHCLMFVDRMMAEQSGTNPDNTLSRSTANHFVRLLLTALRYGASIDLCRNPLAGFEIAEPKGAEIRKKRRAMTADEYRRFAAACVERDERLAANDPGRIPQAPTFMALYEAGRRREEVAAIEWPCVHLDGECPTWEFHGTKGSKLSTTDDGPERYAIPPKLVPCLKALRGLHERTLGRPVGDGDRVFLSPDGQPIHGDNLRRSFYRLLGLARIPRADRRGRTLDLHAARTTVYARGAAAGIPVDQMMTFVGHRDIRTAMRHYRDPNCLDTQRIAAKLAGEQAATDAPVVGSASKGSAPAAPVIREPTPNTPPSVRVGTARARGAAGT